MLMERSPDVMIPTEKTRPLPEQKTLVQFVASAELMAKLEELKNWMAHKNFEGRMDVLIDQVADIALNELRPKQSRKSRSQAAPERKQTPAPGVEKRSRSIPADVKRTVLLRNQNGCTYKDPKSGRVCQSLHGLQFEHIVPFSLGGCHEADNLTLFCSAHNRYQAERMGLN